jgi:UDP-2-acetamido-2-deoxy-ribo-hexuluronate aminotransferase
MQMQFVDLKKQYETIKDKVQTRITKVLDHGMYINGPEVKELEAELSKYTGAKHAIACASGTDALFIPFLALGIKPGDEIIVPNFTFYATAEMVSLIGATPVFVDINPDTYLIDEKLIEKHVTKKTKGIIPVSLYGQTANMDAINEIAKKHGLFVLEDAAQSFGATYKGKKSCNLSSISATSFFPAKPLGCYGDGGAIFTNDDQLALAMREIKEHGSERRYHHTRIGVNGRLDTIQCTILLEKLAIFDWEVKERHRIAARYNKLLSGIKVMKVPSDNTCVYAQYTIEIENRDQVIKKMTELGIPTSVHYPAPLHKQPVYLKEFGHLKIPHSEAACARVLSLPMHPYLTEADQDKVVAALKESMK